MDFLSFREEVTKYIFAEDVLQKADIILIPGNAYPHHIFCQAENIVH